MQNIIPNVIHLVVAFKDTTGNLRHQIAEMSYHIAHPAIAQWRILSVNNDASTVTFAITLKIGADVSLAKFREALDIGFQRLDGQGEHQISLSPSMWREMTCAEVASLAA